MNEFIKVLFTLSISGTLLTLLILGLKQIYKNKCSKRWQYYIWLIAVFRFLIPFTPGSVNIGKLFESVYTAVMADEGMADEEMMDEEITNKEMTPADKSAAAETSENEETASAVVSANKNETKQIPVKTKEDESMPAAADTDNEKAIDIYSCLFFLWAVSALVLFMRRITIYQEFIRYIKAGSTQVWDIDILNLLSGHKEKMGIKAGIELYSSTLISSPVMAGFFRPGIVLPAGELKDKELSYIFMHELTHYKQRDMFYKWLIQTAACIHWFNPFVYLLQKEVNRACELSCDEAVIAMLDDHARREYGDTLISFLRPGNPRKGSSASITALTEGAERLKERLGAIMDFKRKTKAARILTGILTLGISFGAVFAGGYPVAASPESAETKGQPAIKEKGHGTGTYIYDENLDSGWYLDEEDPDEEDLDEKDLDDDWDDKKLIKEYAACGIEKKGGSYYYKDKRVKVIKDQSPDSSFYKFDPELKGTVSIKVVRNSKGKIQRVSYLTKEEAERLIQRAGLKAEEIPVINTQKWNSQDISEIRVSYRTDNIYILPSKTDKVILKEYLTKDDPEYHAGTKIKNHVLTIRSGSRPETNYSSYIEIHVPNDASGNIKVETVSGAITVKHYTGAVSLSTTSGSIYISDSTIAGKLDTVSGNVKLAPAGLSGDLYVYSHSGNIAADLSGSVSCSLKAETATGKILSSCFDLPSRNVRNFSGTVGSGPKFQVAMETFSGNIKID